MSASIVRLSLDTSELRSGDIICTWGMRVLIEGEPQTYPSGRGQTVYYCQGTVTNLAEVWEEVFIPRSY
ncbi:hypothetical protein, partial [Leifsonia sp. NPDC058248]|uniref:hypothetical protein n=1 Tax=Leifsonia sp. NPDC058248 TaxID=3346402 RepID=UPI0036D8DCE7